MEEELEEDVEEGLVVVVVVDLLHAARSPSDRVMVMMAIFFIRNWG